MVIWVYMLCKERRLRGQVDIAGHGCDSTDRDVGVVGCARRWRPPFHRTRLFCASSGQSTARLPTTMSRRLYHGTSTRPSSEPAIMDENVTEERSLKRAANVYDAVAGNRILISKANTSLTIVKDVSHRQGWSGTSRT